MFGAGYKPAPAIVLFLSFLRLLNAFRDVNSSRNPVLSISGFPLKACGMTTRLGNNYKKNNLTSYRQGI